MADKFFDLFNEIIPHVDICSCEARQLTNKPLFLIKDERKFLFLAKEPCEHKLDHLYKDKLEVAEIIKRRLINEQIYMVLVLYFKILKEIRIHDKYKRGIDEQVDKIITSAIKLYSLKERKNKNLKKSYIKKVYSIYNNLINILVQHKCNSENKLKSKQSSCNFNNKNNKSSSNSFQNNIIKSATKNIKLNEYCKYLDEIKEEKIEESRNIEKKREILFKNNLYYKCSNSSELLNNYIKLYKPSEKLKKKLYLKNNLTLINSIRCLNSAHELNGNSNGNSGKTIKLFNYLKGDNENIELRNRNELLKIFKSVLEKEQHISDKKIENNNLEILNSRKDNIIINLSKKNCSEREDNFVHTKRNNSNKLVDLLLNTNSSFTTFKEDNNGNIKAIIHLSENCKKKKKVITLNEYDYFFNSSADELKGVSNEKKDSYSYEKVFFYIDKRKIILDKKNKKKIIFEMDQNGLLKKYTFKKDKKNKNILIKIDNESEWSDDTVDFCYITDNKNKEKIIIKKDKNGRKNRIIYKENELNSTENFNYFKRNIANVKEFNFYDEDEAILRFLKKNIKKRTKIKNKPILKKKKVSEDDSTFYKKELGEVDLKQKRESLINKNVYEINEKSQLDLLSKFKKRKDRFLKGICLFNKKEMYSIKKVQKFKKMKKSFKKNNITKKEKRITDNNDIIEKRKFDKLDSSYKLNEKEKDEKKKILNEKNIFSENQKNNTNYDIKKEFKNNNLPNNIKVLDNKEINKNKYNKLKKKKKSKKSGIYSINKLTSIFAKKITSSNNLEHQEKTSKKIEDFVFNENLKGLSVASYSLSGIISKQSSKSSHYERSLHLTSDNFKNKDNDVISNASSLLSKKENFEIVDKVSSRKISYSIIRSFSSKDDNNISKKKLDALNKTSSSKDDNNVSKKISNSLIKNFKDDECTIFQTESNESLSKKWSSIELSQLNGCIESNTKPDKEENEKGNENENDNLKKKIQQTNEDNPNEHKKRREYLCRGFSAYAHIILSERNIITRKCIISYNWLIKKLRVIRDRKIFEIDGNKLTIQEIPTHDEKNAVVKLVTSKKNYNALIIESGDLTGLQYLGDEIGWFNEEKSCSMDKLLDNSIKELNELKEIYYKLNNNNLQERKSFFDKIKLNKLLGRTK